MLLSAKSSLAASATQSASVSPLNTLLASPALLLAESVFSRALEIASIPFRKQFYYFGLFR